MHLTSSAKDENKYFIFFLYSNLINEIEEIIVRRYLYDYRAFEIFLKNGKSYYFNLYSKDNLKKFFDEISKLRDIEKRIIRYPKKAFEEKKYYQG